ncbi:hypothetical protein [Streptomyces sp. NPDC017102]|uniref:hypothetical protein n=1 Tax=Streptomyces sp. NPDC017102 TaxID=3364978 RepID=UPI0037898952
MVYGILRPFAAVPVEGGRLAVRTELAFGASTVNLERAVQLLGRHQQPVRPGQIRAADGSWTFMLFIAVADEGSRLIACTGVRRLQV